jgi:hypothetical protein
VPAGKGRATLAVAHAVLVILYHILREQKPYSKSAKG